MKRSKSSFNDFSRKHASCEPYYPIRDTENFYKLSVCFCCIISHLEKSLVMFYRNYFSVFYEDIIISLNILPPFEEDLDLPSQITILNPFCTVNNIVLAKYSQAHFLYFIHTRGNGQGPKSEKTWFPFIQGNIWQYFSLKTNINGRRIYCTPYMKYGVVQNKDHKHVRGGVCCLCDRVDYSNCRMFLSMWNWTTV